MLTSIEKPVFDPFQKAWDLYASGGMEALETREAPMFVFVPAANLADQVADRHPRLEPENLRWMIMPDASPIADNHVVVVGGRAVSYYEASEVEQTVMDRLTVATERHMREVLNPENGVGVYRFGRIPTMHHHVVARENWEDGLDWTVERPLVPVEARRVVRDRLAIHPEPLGVGFTEPRLRAIITKALERTLLF